MNRIKLQLQDGVVEYVQVLQDALGPNYTVMLSGGFLRDSFGGAQPKDLDIMAAPTQLTADSFEDPQEILEDISNRLFMAVIPDWYYTSTVVPCDYIKDMQERGLIGLFMGYCPNLEYETQLIIYGKPMNRYEVAHDMDMNINQIVMGPDGVVWASYAFSDGFSHKTIKVLHGYDRGRMSERVNRMSNKYPTFNVEMF